MNIAHYIIGTPDVRHGGASQYACDLALSQARTNNVSLLFPGGRSVFRNKAYVKRKGTWNGIKCYAIVNPVVSPLLFGIKDANYIFSTALGVDTSSVKRFVCAEKLDVLHIHTMMGISSNIIQELKLMGVKVVLTSHDYYGICPRVNLVDSTGRCCGCSDGIYCSSCNEKAASMYKLRVINSPLFLRIKKYFKVLKIKNGRAPDISHEKHLVVDNHSNFVDLRLFYNHIFDLIDIIHFNSKLSEQVYRENGININGVVLPISVNGVSDQRKIWKDSVLPIVTISYVGGLSVNKGFPMLKQVLVELWNEGIKNWNLYVWEGTAQYVDNDCSNIIYKGRYSRSMLSEVFSDTRLHIVPSMCKETFGLTVIEALQYGVPVLVSSNVGAKMLVETISPDLIFENKEDLKKRLFVLLTSPDKLLECNRKICCSTNITFSLDNHNREIMSLYHTILSEE